MKCTKCNNEVADSANFCSLCGTPIVRDFPRKCMKCNQELAEGVNFCSHCGTPVHERAVQPVAVPNTPVQVTPTSDTPWINKAVRNVGIDQAIEKTGLNNTEHWMKGIKGLFDGSGRLGRQQYLAVWVFTYIAVVFASHLIQGGGLTGWLVRASSNALGVTALLTLLVRVVFLWSASKKRLHDLGWASFWLVLLFIPTVHWFFEFVLICVSGKNEPNAFGPDPVAPAKIENK